ncbi:hypothetical protein QIH93_29830 [Bradyrhizobium ottawaense]|nr:MULTISPECIES: hypothetical protein [Bradyrhizobium]WLB50289.1 hypothetical protein QIH93_29830 [Bradyrhizobium ottawaense]WQN86644.1 hypothetical protein U7859_34290 [Bradyrhizobium ottawaense]
MVDGCVSLNDRRALDDLRMQRRKLAVDRKARTGFDCRTTIQQIEEDIIVIEAGLAQMDGTAKT